jgi:hypothetical protein
MKKSYKKLIFPALAVMIFVPLISMAASETFSWPENNKNSVQYRQSSLEGFNHSSVDVDSRILERETRRAENRARQTEMMSVLESGDYNAWLEFAKDKNCPMISQVNEENFSEFVEAHKLRIENRGSESLGKNQNNKNNFRGGVR